MTNSSGISTPLRSGVWGFAALMATALLVGLYISHKITVMPSVYWAGGAIEVLQDDGSWAPAHVSDIATRDSIQTLRFAIQISDAKSWQEPIGLTVSGPFSAEISWDGQLVGEKGIVGDNADSEVPGTIDSISLIPKELLSPGEHQLEIRLSTTRTRVQAARILHIVSLGPYRADERRTLRYYAAPLLLLSGLVLLTVQMLRIGFSTGNRLYAGLGIFASCIILSLMTEVSRAVVNYSYNYHDIRGTFMWLSILSAGLALNYVCYRLQQQSWVKWALLGGFALFAVVGQFGLGGDQQIARNFIFLAATPAAVYLFLLYKKEIGFLTLLPLFWAACYLSFQLSFGIFLDAYIFVASLIFLSGAWFWVYVEKPAPPVQAGPDRLIVKSSGKETPVAAADVVFLKAEGNYTEIHTADGRKLLHQLPIGKLMDDPPDGHIRVHRSYAVNAARIKSLRSAAGSKYWLELEGAEDIPVSRFRVADIRNLLS